MCAMLTCGSFLQGDSKKGDQEKVELEKKIKSLEDVGVTLICRIYDKIYQNPGKWSPDFEICYLKCFVQHVCVV